MKLSSGVCGKRPDGGDIKIFRAENGSGGVLEVIEYGATITRLLMPDKSGKSENVILGKSEPMEHISNPMFNASVIGRIANRVSKGGFEIDGRRFSLDCNESASVTLHSGSGNYAARYFAGAAEDFGDHADITLYLKDGGEGGFENTLDVWVTYSLYEDNRLIITYKTLPGGDTAVALTNHAYFNVGGHASGSVGGHILQLESDFITPFITGEVTSGAVLSVENTPYDFRSPKPVEWAYGDDFSGYDTNFVLRGTGYRRVASLYDPASGRQMDTYTDMPGVQIFTGGKRSFEFAGQDGAVYSPRTYICLETQYFPDSVNVSHYSSPIQRAGQEYISRTGYYFSVR